MFDRARLFALSGLAPIAVGALVAGASPAVADVPEDWTEVDYKAYLIDDPRNEGVIFFATPDGRNCGFFWRDGSAGCDAVPIDAPADTNQVRSSHAEAARFVNSAERTFTHPTGAKTLPEGRKISLGGTTCGVGYQGTVTCDTGEHGFTIAATYSELR